MQPLCATIDGIGLIGPGLTSWPEARSILSGASDYRPQAMQIPPALLLPPAERRRAGTVVRLALAVGQQALSTQDSDQKNIPMVFASSGADGLNCHEICTTLASSDRRLSPTRFHNAVSNAAAGYWSIATHDDAPSIVVSAFDTSFAAGLVEALCQVTIARTPCLLIAYDAPYPEPLNSARPILDSFAIALLLRPERNARKAAIRAQLSAAQTNRLTHPALENLRHTIPAARGLPLLQCLASGQNGRVVLDYLTDSRLEIEIDMNL